MTDVIALADKIKSTGRKKYFIAQELGLSYQGLQNKLDGKTEFTVSEARTIKDLLSLTNEEACAIFFANEGDK